MTWGYTESGTPRHREGHDGYIDGIQHRDVDKRQRECSHYEWRYGRDGYEHGRNRYAWLTSASDDLAAREPVPVSGGAFTASLPEMSVATFVGK